MKISTLLKSPGNWTQGFFARDKFNNPVNSNNPGAVKFCLVGAMRICYPDLEKRQDALDKLTRALPRRYKRSGVVLFNDARTRKFSDIQRLVRRAKV